MRNNHNLATLIDVTNLVCCLLSFKESCVGHFKTLKINWCLEPFSLIFLKLNEYKMGKDTNLKNLLDPTGHNLYYITNVSFKEDDPDEIDFETDFESDSDSNEEDDTNSESSIEVNEYSPQFNAMVPSLIAHYLESDDSDQEMNQPLIQQDQEIQIIYELINLAEDNEINDVSADLSTLPQNIEFQIFYAAPDAYGVALAGDEANPFQEQEIEEAGVPQNAPLAA